MITEYVQQLLGLPLFRTYTADSLEQSLKLHTYNIIKFKKGQIIFNEGEKCDVIFIILDGKVRIQKIDSSGRYLTIDEAGPGEMMGPNVLFSHNSIYPLSTDAMTDVVILTLSKNTVLEMCQENMNFLETLLRITSGKAFMLTRKLNEVTVQTLKQNISRFIMDIYDKTGNTEVILPFTKKMWADKLGVQRTSLQREIKNLENLGIIRVDRNSIQILDLEGLSSFAED